MTTIAIASDHAGYEMKAQIASWLADAGYEVLDLGCNGPESVDYPDFATALAAAINDKRAARGVLICGSGIGISIAANRHPGIRAALVHDVTTARLARQHNDANVVALGARIIGAEIAKDCVDAFLKTDFEGGERHSRRIAKMG
ncbi:ribose 5-phosphate isomerase B [Azospirillum brasilense]|uniref:Ribose 5-phosphate isomerase B n=1 Tax=Azospirillum brasilense TaxID=192 RepID=A0A0P0ESY2_AZOBR|nr:MULTISPECIES: ribose 5-phosphate isomerase B [Azospirillum]ALJ35428.1 ribose 5-phosphate isomerase [Azospirillum brasilense]MDW7556818.1 ribose 5-phosphate isomerase B [Azospirillum brasilense]MDW7596587.1 ribose 5-phosphate isomerase B [Azospirillum brasilense]MDW7631468.1 ribose 5-phosphate isomerase B [Azospirillum brasilense]MDX5954148.1 ribose 5-phosphate isomerase B [Azospirillum brasilense]